MEFHIQKRNAETPDIINLDDEDTTNDDIPKVKGETVSDIAKKGNN